jgi:hypothetical protein
MLPFDELAFLQIKGRRRQERNSSDIGLEARVQAVEHCANLLHNARFLQEKLLVAYQPTFIISEKHIRTAHRFMTDLFGPLSAIPRSQ